MAVMRLKIELDPDKVADLDNAVNYFRDMASETEKAALDVRRAMLDLRDALNVVREEEED